MKLNLGCGTDVKEGWINIDLDIPQQGTRGGTQTLVKNLMKGLPKLDLFGEQIINVSFITSSHFWEHLSPPDGMKLLRECYDVLAPGGCFRMGLPKTREAFKAYLEGDLEYFKMIIPWVASKKDYYEPGTSSMIDLIDISVHQFGEHMHVIDQDKACKMLEAAGFLDVFQDQFDPRYDVDNPLRRHFTFYVQGVKLS